VVLIPSLALLQLAAGGVLVGLMAGVLTRRLLRMLRWHGASASQVSACSGAPLACQHAGRPPVLLLAAHKLCGSHSLSCTKCICIPHLQLVATIQAMGYLAFYVANAPLKVSGTPGGPRAATLPACAAANRC
jgi:hypothetical protein